MYILGSLVYFMYYPFIYFHNTKNFVFFRCLFRIHFRLRNDMLHLLEHGQHPVRSGTSWKRTWWWRNCIKNCLRTSTSWVDWFQFRLSIENLAAIHESTTSIFLSINRNQFSSNLTKLKWSTFILLKRNSSISFWTKWRHVGRAIRTK